MEKILLLRAILPAIVIILSMQYACIHLYNQTGPFRSGESFLSWVVQNIHHIRYTNINNVH